jgi:diguanylate cyclase (GGDEF)-like protein
LTEQATPSDVFRLLADSLSAAVDEDFFPRLVASLGEILGVEHVLVSRVDGNGTQARTLAIWSRGRLIDNIDYPLAGTPCERIVRQEACHFDEGVCQLFPQDPILVALDVEAYIRVPMYTPNGRPLGLVAVMHGTTIRQSDQVAEILRITAARAGAELARQEAERLSHTQLLRTNRALTLFSRCNEALIHAEDEQTLLDAICTMAVEIGGYRMAWVGFAQQDADRHILPKASAGADREYLEHIELSWSEDQTSGQGPAGNTIRSGKPVVILDIQADAGFVNWRERALNCGFRGVICLPLKRGERVFGLLVLYQGSVIPVSEEELRLLSDLADDLAFGITTLRGRLEQKRLQLAVMKIATAVSARTGEEFLDKLTHHMAEALEADLAFIARPNELDPAIVRTQALVIDGERQTNFRYTLEGSPCESVLRDEECIIHDGAAPTLPLEGREALSWVRAYAGRRLDNANGEVIGLLGVMFRQPLADAELVSRVLQIFAAGVAAELERQKDEEQIRQLAFRDSNTELPNRTDFMRRLEAKLSRSDTPRVALLFLDLDRFKDINDTQGHDIGDRVLYEVARGFRSALNEREYLARLGGDEFVVMLQDADTDSATATAERLLATLKAPLEIDRQSFELDVSIGIAFYPDDASNARELLKHTDIAMYEAKRSGRGYRLFEARMGATLASRLAMTRRLAEAIEQEGLSLHFQPQVDLMSGELVGAEVLCRWHDETFGDISPADFIPLAEERGLIIPLGNWVIEASCRQLGAWQAAGRRMPGQLAINVASRQFDDETLLDTLRGACRRHEIKTEQLGLELTESGLMNDPDQAIAMTRSLKAAGFGLSIDDFGTGYSSLAYLKRFATDKIKIDISFIRDMLVDDNDHAIVTTIIAMARSLNLDTVAEGVETAEQARELKALGCRQAQGYHFGRPLIAEAFARHWLT